MDQEIWKLSANELASEVANRRVSAKELVAACLKRIDQTNPTINAICTLAADNANAQAEAVDHRLAAGEPPRDLEGVPFVVKDVIATAGIRTTFGSKLFERNVPIEDSVSVGRLKAHGAIVIGKTNTPEFAHLPHTSNSLFGTTRNPWDINRTAGGSSGGSAAAIAAGMVPIGLGTDLGGSIRGPAAFCGILGLRPSPGRVPVYPSDFAWDTLVEHVHAPMARTTLDIGYLLRALSGPDDRAPNSLPLQPVDYVIAASGSVDIRGRRLAFSRDLGGLAPVDNEVAEITAAAAQSFESMGCIVEEHDPDVSDLKTIIAGTRGFGMVARYAGYLKGHRDMLSPQLIQQMEAALGLDVHTITQAERLRTSYYHRMRHLLETYDYLLTPAAGVTAFRVDIPLPNEIGGRHTENFYDTILFQYAVSVVGLPAISIPCGFDSRALPVGLQIVGRRLSEHSVLEAAAAYESAHGARAWPPPVESQGALAEDNLVSPPATYSASPTH
jgi:amidase